MPMREKRQRELEDRFLEAVRFLEREVRAYHLDDWRAMDVTMPQAKTLALLENLGPLRMGEIAAHLGSGLSATTALVDRLVEKDLIERGSDPADRRVVVCELTTSGRKSMEQALGTDPDRIQATMELLDDERLEVVVQGLEWLCEVGSELRKRNASG